MIAFVAIGLVYLLRRSGRQSTATATAGNDSALPPAGVAPPAPAASTARQVFTNSIGMELVRIEAGQFVMGSPESEVGREPRERRHQVRITRPFMLGAHEVTRGQFSSFVSASGYLTDAEKQGWGFAWQGGKWQRASGASWRRPGFEQTADQPVVSVTWTDAIQFCSWLSGQEQGKRYRLPTEAEWEYACRAGTTTRFVCGESEENLHKYANYCEISNTNDLMWQDKDHNDGHDKTAPVGSFLPNAWGLYDMHGNVWEWCADWYDKDWYDREHARGVVSDDPTGPTTGAFRVVRGAAWFDRPWGARSAYRDGGRPDSRDSVIGFRVALELPEQSDPPR